LSAAPECLAAFNSRMYKFCVRSSSANVATPAMASSVFTTQVGSELLVDFVDSVSVGHSVTLDNSREITALSFACGGDWIVSSYRDGHIKVWNSERFGRGDSFGNTHGSDMKLEDLIAKVTSTADEPMMPTKVVNLPSQSQANKIHRLSDAQAIEMKSQKLEIVRKQASEHVRKIGSLPQSKGAGFFVVFIYFVYKNSHNFVLYQHPFYPLDKSTTLLYCSVSFVLIILDRGVNVLSNVHFTLWHIWRRPRL
jgi:hypothetical protein